MASAAADLSRFLGSGPPSLVALAARGKIREDDKRLALARADYDATLKLRADPDLYLARGRVDEALGQLAELDTRLGRRPNDLARLSRARALLALGRDTEAARELEAIVARNPGPAEAQTLLTSTRSRLTPARP